MTYFQLISCKFLHLSPPSKLECSEGLASQNSLWDLNSLCLASPRPYHFLLNWSSSSGYLPKHLRVYRVNLQSL